MSRDMKHGLCSTAIDGDEENPDDADNGFPSTLACQEAAA